MRSNVILSSEEIYLSDFLIIRFCGTLRLMNKTSDESGNKTELLCFNLWRIEPRCLFLAVIFLLTVLSCARTWFGLSKAWSGSSLYFFLQVFLHKICTGELAFQRQSSVPQLHQKGRFFPKIFCFLFSFLCTLKGDSWWIIIRLDPVEKEQKKND